MAKSGGVIGIYMMPFLNAKGQPTSDHLLAHIEHAINICGEDHVGIGSDLSISPHIVTDEYIDNQKKFLSKFGIYNKQSIPSNLFISGNFDLQNIRSSFYEISDNEKLTNEDVNFIEEEFNDFMLSDGYENLFRFPKFKEFVKLITSE